MSLFTLRLLSPHLSISSSLKLISKFSTISCKRSSILGRILPLASDGPPSRLGDRVEDILQATRNRSLYWPGHAFQHHLSSQLHALFDPFKVELRACVGFNLDDALTILTSLERLLNSRIGLCATKLFAMSKASRPELYREGHSDEENRQIVADITTYFQQQIRPVAHRIFEVKSEELSQATGIDKASIKRFMDYFSTEFGQREVGDGWPSAYEPLDSSPLLKLYDDSWLVHLAHNILWRLKVVFEHIIARILRCGPDMNYSDRST